jgi:hypothetical protein
MAALNGSEHGIILGLCRHMTGSSGGVAASAAGGILAAAAVVASSSPPLLQPHPIYPIQVVRRGNLLPAILQSPKS